MDEFTVELRIYGSELDVSSVTATLGLEPSLVRHVGERRSADRNWKESMWSFDGFPQSAEAVTWPSLEQGLAFLLEKLWPVRQSLEIYNRNHKLVLWCGHFHSNSSATISLSPDVLKKIGDLGVELIVENYRSSESEQETIE